MQTTKEAYSILMSKLEQIELAANEGITNDNAQKKLDENQVSCL